MDVVDSIEHLLSIVAHKILSKWPRLTDPAEQFAVRDSLLHDVGHLSLFVIVQPQCRILLEFVVPDNMFVVHMLPNDAFFAQLVECLFLNLSENLHSVLLAISLVFGEHDYRSVAAAELATKYESVQMRLLCLRLSLRLRLCFRLCHIVLGKFVFSMILFFCFINQFSHTPYISSKTISSYKS